MSKLEGWGEATYYVEDPASQQEADLRHREEQTSLQDVLTKERDSMTREGWKL